MGMSLKKLARLANVSDVTVMRALRGEKCVKPELRERIQDLAKEHRYEPNLLAKGLLQGKTQTIGIVVPDISAPHYSASVASAMEVLKEAGFRAIVLNSGYDPKSEFEEIRQAAMRRVDGLLMIACSEAAEAGHFEEIEKRKLPLVLMSRVMQAVPFDIFTGADEEDGYDLTQKLIKLGHTRIAHIAPPNNLQPNEWLRTKGWRNAMTDAGLPTDNLEIQPDSNNTEQHIYQTMKSLLSENDAPTAVFTSYSSMIAPILKVMNKQNLSPGKDISLATFHPGNPHSPALSLPPKIAGYFGPSQAIGQQAAKRLVELINSKAQLSANPKVTKIKGTWVNGESIAAINLFG